MKFNKEILIDLAYGDDVEGFKILHSGLVDTSRWSLHYETVFEFEGRPYLTSYSRGATENQIESPYEVDDDEVECTPLRRSIKKIIEYVPDKPEYSRYHPTHPITDALEPYGRDRCSLCDADDMKSLAKPCKAKKLIDDE